jgi:arginine repressor
MNNALKVIHHLKQQIKGNFKYDIIESDNSFNIIGTINEKDLVVVVPKDKDEFNKQFNQLEVN